jgi:alpha-tubulin suppressor-like RCC1 family protein
MAYVLRRDSDSGDNGFSTPQLITALLGEPVRAIAAGPDMSCAVTDAGALYTWGDNTFDNLGHGDDCGECMPTLVTTLQGIRVVGVATAEEHTLALAADGKVYAFGEGPGLGIRLEGASGGEGVVGPLLTPQRIPNLKCMVLW